MPPMAAPRPPMRHLNGRFLGKRIGRHDRARGGGPLVDGERGDRDRQAASDFLNRQRDADHAG